MLILCNSVSPWGTNSYHTYPHPLSGVLCTCVLHNYLWTSLFFQFNPGLKVMWPYLMTSITGKTHVTMRNLMYSLVLCLHPLTIHGQWLPLNRGFCFKCSLYLITMYIIEYWHGLEKSWKPTGSGTFYDKSHARQRLRSLAQMTDFSVDFHITEVSIAP